MWWRVSRRRVADVAAASTHLGAAHVLCAEKELAVEVGIVDCVQIDHCNIIEPGEHEVLDQLAADATGTDDQDLFAFDRCAREALRDICSRHVLDNFAACGSVYAARCRLRLREK